MPDPIFSILDTIVEEVGGSSQIREEVPIEDWIGSTFYIGEDARYLYPFWEREIIDFYNSGCSEWIITGSLGAGKSTIANLALLRKVYELSCYYPIPYLFDLMKSTMIFFIYFSVSMTQAKRTGYGKLLRMVDSIPYFQRYYVRDKGKDSEILFDNLTVVYGSSTSHQIGLDLIGGILDEGDFFKNKTSKSLQEYSEARNIYNAMENRRKLRFSLEGKDQGLSILISSAAFNTSFVEERIERSRETGTAFVTEVTGFKVTRAKFSPEEFPVFPGTEDIEPALLLSLSDIHILLETIGKDSGECPKDYLSGITYLSGFVEVEFVPYDFIEQFREDAVKAVQDILGKSTRASSTYMDDKLARLPVVSCMKHPFRRPVVSLSTKNDIFLEEFLIEKYLGDKELPRAIHIDQSVTTDRTGIACSYFDDDDTGVVEWMLAIAPPGIGEIPIIRCVQFVVYLRDLGYNILRVTMDSYQSRASLQYLEQEGIDCGLYSVDRDDEAYAFLRQKTVQNLVVYYDYPLYIKEVQKLIWDKLRKKIDHPKNGSKDVADAVAGSLWNANIIRGMSATPFIGSL